MARHQNFRRLASILSTAVLLAAAALPASSADAVPANAPDTPGLVALIAHFSDAGGSYPGRSEAVAEHRRAAEADQGAAHRAHSLFEALVASDPHDPLLAAFLGSSSIMKGRDQSFPPARLASIKAGLALLDGAVSAAPGDFTIRLLRVASTMNLPDFLRDLDVIRADLHVMLAHDDRGAAAPRLTPDTEARLRVVLAWTCLKQGERSCAARNLSRLSSAPTIADDLLPPIAALSAAIAP